MAISVVRVLAIAALWMAYLGFPVFAAGSGIFAHDKLPLVPRWDESLRFALAFLGYCTLGAWLYALTGGRQGTDEQGRPYPDFRERLMSAMLCGLIFVALFGVRMIGDN